MRIQHHFSLKPYNTFGFSASADTWIEYESAADLYEIYKEERWQNCPKYCISGGSNVMLAPHVEGVVLHSAIRGIQVVEQNDCSVLLKVGGGEDWDSFVGYTVDKGWSGLENLSYIPGMVGTSPIQNIGAYGVEVKDTLVQVDYFDTDDLCMKTIAACDCQFGYRDSVFKKALKGKAVITHVWFTLKKNGIPELSYGHLKNAVEDLGEVTVQNVRRAIVQIRRAKLPEPEDLGSAGSFFKNPYVSVEQLKALQIKYPEIPFYPVDEQRVKLPAGWLIDQCGWKGYRQGDAGVHKQQALVLVNYGSATRADVLALSAKICASVQKKYGILLEREVNLLPE